MQEPPYYLSPRNTAPKDPARVPQAIFAVIAGATDQERTEQHIGVLRRFTDLALREAERLDRQAEAQAARIEQPAVEEPEPETDTAPEPERPSGEVSRALFRLARIARYNIALEQHLIEEPRFPGPRAAGPRGQQKRAEQAAKIEASADDAERMFLEIAQTDPGLDRERLEALVEELDEGFADGRFDEPMQRLTGTQIGYLLALDLVPEPDWNKFFTGKSLIPTPEERAAAGYPDPVPDGVAPEADGLEVGASDGTGAPCPDAAAASSPDPGESVADPTEPMRSGRDPP
jgi:hypothetical protein